MVKQKEGAKMGRRKSKSTRIPQHHHRRHLLVVVLLLLFLAAAATTVDGFLTTTTTSSISPRPHHYQQQQQQQQQELCSRSLHVLSNTAKEDVDAAATTAAAAAAAAVEPQVLSSGYSQALEMTTALEEAMDMALEGLPVPTDSSTAKIDLAIVSVSSLYDGNARPSDVVPTLLQAAFTSPHYGTLGIQNLIGGTNGGFVSSLANLNYCAVVPPAPSQQQQQEEAGSEEDHDFGKDVSGTVQQQACRPIEREGVPGVTVTLAILPDVNVQTFHVMGDDVPDDYETRSKEDWMAAVGLKAKKNDNDNDDNDDDKDDKNTGSNTAAVMVIPSPAFQKSLDDLLQGLSIHVSPTIFGAIASTVSSLSRARLFRYDAKQQQQNGDGNGNGSCIQTLADGCVGVVLSGDIEVQMMIAQGAKPVGGVYQIVKGQETTISAIALDESATELVQAEEDDEVDQDDDDNDDDNTMSSKDNKAKMAQAYAKARIPKPVLAEANFLMKTLSDDDQAFMRKAILVGLERGGALGRTPSELARLAEGKGHAFAVHQVATASMKDGSVTLPLGSVDIQPGQRLRFYVRESPFAKKEVDALWTGYKRRVLAESKKMIKSKKEEDGEVTAATSIKPPFTPTGCFLFPTLDRGNKFFMGKAGYESQTVMEFLPTLPSLSGFFSNGVIGSLDANPSTIGSRERTSQYGSASGYVLFGSKSRRPIYVPGRASAEAARAQEEKVLQEAEEKRIQDKSGKDRDDRVKAFDSEKKAPRDEDGELILRRREIHSGRAMTVSTVEWSVAEKTATPTSALEGFMWDKETEVDRFRERVPLSNLVSQCRLSMVDPSKPKPRDWIGPIREAAAKGSFVIIPECKRLEPGSGSLRKRYDISKLAKEFTLAGVPAMSVNCDAVLFGGTLDDVTSARDSSSKAALEKSDGSNEGGVVVPPILASDLLLYPYQLYKMLLAGADAVNLMVAALEAKDLVYLTKIAASLKMQTFVTVTSTKQIEDLDVVPAGGVTGLIISNRNLEDFSFDMSGQQALDILKSDALKKFREKHGEETAILAEGRVGIVTGEMKGGSPENYIKELQKAGAIGAIVGAALVPDETRKSPLETLLEATTKQSS